jgi:hypothetical protein
MKFRGVYLASDTILQGLDRRGRYRSDGVNRTSDYKYSTQIPEKIHQNQPVECSVIDRAV